MTPRSVEMQPLFLPQANFDPAVGRCLSRSGALLTPEDAAVFRRFAWLRPLPLEQIDVAGFVGRVDSYMATLNV